MLMAVTRRGQNTLGAGFGARAIAGLVERDGFIEAHGTH